MSFCSGPDWAQCLTIYWVSVELVWDGWKAIASCWHLELQLPSLSTRTVSHCSLAWSRDGEYLPTALLAAVLVGIAVAFLENLWLLFE
jgi:hypothetical protein